MPYESKPEHVQLQQGTIKDLDFTTPLEETVFETPGERDAARYILMFWERYKALSPIAQHSGWSDSHVQEVFRSYFEAADERTELLVDVQDEIGDRTQQYKEGYRDGFKDGFADAQQ